MSKSVRYWSAAAVLMLFLTAAAVLVLDGTPQKQYAGLSFGLPDETVGYIQPMSLADEDIQTHASDPNGYLVLESDGIVGVYSTDGTVLFETLPIVTESLRAVDAERLREGIEVSSDDDLARLVEDFSS